MITFIIPVRDPRTVDNWAPIKARLAHTLRSVSAQRDGDWQCVVVANRGTDLPVADGIEIAIADFPLLTLPEVKKTAQYYEGVRLDKGRRIMFGLVHAQPCGHTMVVDYDDLVSYRLAGHCASDPDANGWFMDKGYFLSDDGKTWPCPERFYRICGSSLLIHSRLLRIPQRFEDADPAYYSAWMGSHKFSVPELEKLGTPLAPLPFPGAAYRVGHAETTSGSGLIDEMVDMTHSFHPGTQSVPADAIAPASAAFAEEFYGA